MLFVWEEALKDIALLNGSKETLCPILLPQEADGVLAIFK
jgi:hypothetical protein